MRTIFQILAFLVLSFNVFGQNTILWRITNNNNNNVSVIMGTFHPIGNSFVDSVQIIKNYLKACDIVILESLDNSQTTKEKINNRIQSNEIIDVLRKNDFNYLKDYFANENVDLLKLKPIEISWRLQQDYIRLKCGSLKNTDTWNHMETYLQYLANENNKRLIGIETDTFQIRMIESHFGNPTFKEERKNIHYWIEQLRENKINFEFCSFYNSYITFKLDYKLSDKCGNNELIRIRNRNWMEILPNMIENYNCFIAVGIFHLYNDCGLINEIKDLGYNVEPINIVSR